jgi:hypothetical protein
LRLVRRALSPEESIEQVRKRLRRDADPMVGYCCLSVFTHSTDAHHDLTVLWRVFEGIRQQVREDLAESRRIG